MTSSESDEDLSDNDRGDDHDRVVERRSTMRKGRTTVTREIVSSIVSQMNQDPRPKIKDIAASVDLAQSTVKRLLRKIRAGEFDYGETILFTPKRKGRKPAVSREKSARVKVVLTTDPTATLATAKTPLWKKTFR